MEGAIKQISSVNRRRKTNLLLLCTYVAYQSHAKYISNFFLTKYSTKSIKFNLLFYPDWIKAKNGTLNGSC